eukprot:1303743-Pyramimonas_sp.AAC.1
MASRIKKKKKKGKAESATNADQEDEMVALAAIFEEEHYVRFRALVRSHCLLVRMRGLTQVTVGVCAGLAYEGGNTQRVQDSCSALSWAVECKSALAIALAHLLPLRNLDCIGIDFADVRHFCGCAT